MVERASQGVLFASPADADCIAINDRCLLRTVDGHRLVSVSGVTVAHFAAGDRMAEAHAMVSLVEQGWADQNDVARAFGCAARSLRRFQRRFEEGGLVALERRPGYPRGRSRLRASRLRQVRQWRADGASNRQIAGKLGVSEPAVRKLLRRLGFKAAPPPQDELQLGAQGANPNLSALPATPPPNASSIGTEPLVVPSDPSPSGADPNLSAFPAEPELAISADRNPLDRSGDRLLAHLGLLNDAVPLFASGERLPHAGVLLAVPAILDSGVVDCAREVYGCIGPAFYGLRTTMVTLVLMALLRIRHPENRKPPTTGRSAHVRWAGTPGEWKLESQQPQAARCYSAFWAACSLVAATSALRHRLGSNSVS